MREDEEFQEIIVEFLAESQEGLDLLTSELMSLETVPDPDALASIFRTIHTIKGTSGYLGFEVLERLTHLGESLLSKLREGELQVNGPTTAALLWMVDSIRSLLRSIQDSGGEDGGAPIDELVAELKRLQDPSAYVGETSHTASDAVAGMPTDLQAETLAGEERSGLRSELLTEAAAESLERPDNPREDPLSRRPFPPASPVVQSIDLVWSRFTRVVRDLAFACDKKARIVLVGGETELDRGILEAIKDPLTHLIRNSIDHGLEHPAERTLAGKPEEGIVLLAACHQGGQIQIKVADDGRGIPHDRIRERALEEHFLTPAQAALMTPRDLVNLIFEPGFSTAETVTKVSGRGVGLDVVKTNVESIGGTVEAHTALGRGTTFHLKIPVTDAVTSTPIVHSGGEHVAIPDDAAEIANHVAEERSSGFDELVGLVGRFEY